MPPLQPPSLRIIATLILSALLTSDANAVLRNRYSFTTNADDSVGSQHGTLMGTNGSFTDGQLVLANNGEGSQSPGTTGAYLDLPNGVVTSAAQDGTPGVLSVEMWITIQANRDRAAAFTAGNSVNGENTSDCCNDDQPYIEIIPRSGDVGQGNDFRVTTNSYDGTEAFVDDGGPGNGADLTIGLREHVVAVFDQSGGMPGNLTVYLNGSLMGSSPIAANLNLNTFQRADLSGSDVNVWLGRSQSPNSLVAASYDEVRIYSHALTAADALGGTVFGPDIIGETAIPSIEVNKTTGEIKLRNNAAAPVKLDYYSITSMAGALKTGTWSSLDDQNYNAVDGEDMGSVAGDSLGEGWDRSGSSNEYKLIEVFLSPAGSMLAPSDILNLGLSYNTSKFGNLDGDLVFKFGVLDGPLITAPVTYVSTAVNGDYNNNGVVDAADYVLWRNDGPLQNDPTPGVQPADYDFWRENFNKPGSGAGSGSVPEPAASALLGLSLLLMSASLRAPAKPSGSDCGSKKA